MYMVYVYIVHICKLVKKFKKKRKNVKFGCTDVIIPFRNKKFSYEN